MIAVDAQNDAAKQTNDVEDLIQKGVDVVVINPTDSDAVASAVSAANAKKCSCYYSRPRCEFR